MLRIKESVKIDILLVLTLFFPVFAEQLASILLSVFSSAVSSNIDTVYLNATTLVTNIVNPITTINSSIALGSGILISQYMGADDREKSRKLFATSNLLGLILSFAIALVFICFSKQIVSFFYPNMSESFFYNASIYSVFYSLCIPLIFLRTNVVGILRGSLNTKAALYISLSLGVLSLVLRFLLMIVFQMGIFGLGISSFLSNVIVTLLSVFLLKRIDTFKGTFLNIFKLFDKTVAIDTVKIGSVMCIQSFAVSTASLIVTQILATMGDLEISAYNITTSVQSLLVTAANSLAYVAQIVSGKYTGANEKRHAYNISIFITLVGTALSVIIALLSVPFSKLIVGMYTSDTNVIPISASALSVYMLSSCLFFASANILSAGIRGAGNVKFPAIVLVISAWIYKIPATWFTCVYLNKGAIGCSLVNGIEQIIFGLFFIIFMLVNYKRVKAKTNEKN